MRVIEIWGSFHTKSYEIHNGNKEQVKRAENEEVSPGGDIVECVYLQEVVVSGSDDS